MHVYDSASAQTRSFWRVISCLPCFTHVQAWHQSRASFATSSVLSLAGLQLRTTNLLAGRPLCAISEHLDEVRFFKEPTTPKAPLKKLDHEAEEKARKKGDSHRLLVGVVPLQPNFSQDDDQPTENVAVEIPTSRWQASLARQHFRKKRCVDGVVMLAAAAGLGLLFAGIACLDKVMALSGIGVCLLALAVMAIVPACRASADAGGSTATLSENLNPSSSLGTCRSCSPGTTSSSDSAACITCASDTSIDIKSSAQDAGADEPSLSPSACCPTSQVETYRGGRAPKGVTRSAVRRRAERSVPVAPGCTPPRRRGMGRPVGQGEWDTHSGVRRSRAAAAAAANADALELLSPEGEATWSRPQDNRSTKRPRTVAVPVADAVARQSRNKSMP